MAKRTSKLKLLPVTTPNAEPIPLKSVKPVVSWIKVTPELANKWLEEANTNNRKVRDDYVARLAADMATGKWRGQNGEAIRFDTNGRLVDGQHRLWAAFTANVSFETLMITNVDPTSYSTIGIGRPKSFGDFIGPMGGEKNVTMLAAATRLVYFWQHGLLPQMKSGSIAPTISQLETTLREHPKLRDSVNAVMSMNDTRKLLTGSFCALIHYAGTIHGRHAMAESFLDRLGSGLGLTADDPVHHLRKFLLSQKGPKTGFRRAGQLYVLALTIKAWNFSKNEKTTEQLRFGTNESFPQL